jgi:hypothetical protein
VRVVVLVAVKATAETILIEIAVVVHLQQITIHLLQTIIIQTQTTTETGTIERETESTWTREMKRAGDTKAVVELVVAPPLRTFLDPKVGQTAATSQEKAVALITMVDPHHPQQLI